MKKVINTPVPSDIILLEYVLEKKSPLIGFKLTSGSKVTLVPMRYASDHYFARCVNGWEIGDSYSPYGKYTQTIAEWEKFFREHHAAEMFLFDSPQKLFKWLAE